MATNKDDYSDNLANLDFKSKMKLFQSQNKTKQSSEAVSETSTRERPQTKSVSTVSQESPNTQTDKSIRSSPLQEPPSGNNERPSNASSPGNVGFHWPIGASVTKTTLIYARQFPPPESSKGESAELKSPSDEPRSLPLQKPPKGNDERPSNESRSNKTFEEELQEKIKEVSSRKNRGWSPEDMEVFKHPMCLISAENVKNEHGEEDKIMLKSEQEVFKQIEQIEMPMVIVAVVGLYRTGKSYLMNRLAESTKGFALGDTIQSKTKGIWVWCKMHPEMSDTVLLLLDTEGLGDVEKGDTSHDNKIFTLATLLCNCLVYNMKGAFDNDAVSKLTFVTEMAKNIRFRGESSEDNKTLNLILPDFVLCLRDFSLKLIIDEKMVSANEYLEFTLAENKSKAANFNKPRECIRKFFQKRMCFAFPVPGDGDVLENLETLGFDDLSAKFRIATTNFVSHIYSIPPKDLLASKPVTGPMFVTLVDRYVTAIKHGAVPDVDDAFEAVAKIENAKIEKEAIEIFEHQIEGVNLPVTSEILGNFYTEAQQNALNYLRKNVVHDKKNDCENKAQMKMDNIWNKIRESNNEKVRELCDQKLQEAFAKYLKENFENKEYEAPGGYRKYQRDIARLKEDFESDLRDFKEHEIMWTWHGFVKEMKEIEAKIVQADEELSLKEKEDEQRRNQESIDKLLKEHQKAQHEALEQQKKDLESHYNKLEKDRLDQLQIERQRYEALLQEKVEKEAAQREVERMKREQEERMAEMKKEKEIARLKAIEDAENEAKRLIEEKEKERQSQYMHTRMWNAFWNM
ncbi:guanylate-binding protein 1-like isoform X2 [Ruditapes philippinarum]|uniref:guanylate-binding protein 1-like isoform X2 n=1 Tax=Ruditapes philippinarum TaxID=129788 RepID=UPI00295B7675|nr:guanylate-binding protein 1-like isoform X2 [Ruditapes philippinarum]